MKETQVIGQFFDKVSDPANSHESFNARLGGGSNGSAGYANLYAKYIQTDGGIYEHTLGIWAPDSSVDPRFYDSSLSMVMEDRVAIQDLTSTGIEAFLGFSVYFDAADFSTRTGVGFHAEGGLWYVEAKVSTSLVSAENTQILRRRSTGLDATQYQALRMVANARTRTIEWWINGTLFDWITPVYPVGGWSLAQALTLRHEIKTTSGSARLYFGAGGPTLLAVGEPEAADLVAGSVLQPTISTTGVTDRFVRLLGSAYSTAGDAGEHQFTQWQISTSATFDTLIYDSNWTPINLLLQDYTGLTPETLYYARHRYRSDKCYESAWSTPASFTTLALQPDDPTNTPSTPWGPNENPCEPNAPPPSTTWTQSDPC